MIFKMFKKIIYILLLIIILAPKTYAGVQKAGVKYSGYSFEFKKGDDKIFENYALINLRMAEKAQTPDEKLEFINEAMRYYFMLEKMCPNSIEAQIGLGKVYDEKNLDRYAKEHFFKALNFDKNNPSANLNFANYFYKRKEYIQAIYLYNRAYNLGYQNNYYLNLRIADIYEKLADLEAAKRFYQNAYNLNPSDPKISEKIQQLINLNYGGSQYYLFNKK